MITVEGDVDGALSLETFCAGPGACLAAVSEHTSGMQRCHSGHFAPALEHALLLCPSTPQACSAAIPGTQSETIKTLSQAGCSAAICQSGLKG